MYIDHEYEVDGIAICLNIHYQRYEGGVGAVITGRDPYLHISGIQKQMIFDKDLKNQSMHLVLSRGPTSPLSTHILYTFF